MATDAAHDEVIGSLVDGRYTIIEAMASGSMGAVYKAERVPVGKIVAIKFLHASFAHDAEFLTRFERETRVMSKLAHPNCVSIVDFGVWDGSPYLVMEYVGGVTLRSVLDDGALEPRRALGLARQIAAGLAHAHSHDVVHRDIKPANLMISEAIGAGETIRILDFGLARLRGGGGRDATQANVVVGTPNYMAPEQTIGGGTIDARTDVYALGVVLFEMLTGDRPFVAEETLALLGMHRAAPIPRLANCVPDGTELPDGVQEVIDTAMAKAPDDRYQSAIDFARALEAVLDGRPARATSRSGPRSKKHNAAAIAPTVAGLGVETAPVRRASAPATSRAALAVFAVLALGCAGVAAWYVLLRGGSGGGAATEPATALTGTAAAPTPPAPVVEPAADAAAVTADAAAADVVGVIDAAVVPHVEDVVEVTADAGAEAAVVPGEVEPEIEMDPETAINPAPPREGDDEPDDEAADAPATPEDAEQRAPAPPAPVLATTTAGAIQLIRDGKRDLALASLRALHKKSPKNAYLPFLLGNLYADQRWWSVAMDHYRAAITLDARYKRNATLNRNVIRMLVSPKTVGTATYFLKKTIGKPAVPYLKAASTQEKHPLVRKRAAHLAKTIR